MENVARILPEPLMLRANRKVIQERCSICNEGFKLAEETYSCPFCSGYHHAACWETHRACPGQNGVSATTSGVDNQTQINQAPINETQIAIAPVPAVAEGERRCASCAKAIRREALKCRFCGYVFDQAYAVATEEIPRQLAQSIESYANKSLTTSIIGLIICICAPVLGPMAISNGSDARRLLNEYPSYAAQTSAGGKALAGIIIGWIEIIIFVLNFLSGIGGSS